LNQPIADVAMPVSAPAWRQGGQGCHCMVHARPGPFAGKPCLRGPTSGWQAVQYLRTRACPPTGRHGWPANC